MTNEELASLKAKAKVALRIASTTTAFDEEIEDILRAAEMDLGLTAGISMVQTVLDPLIMRAIITYVRLNFGQPDDYDRLKASYHEQKAQLQSCSGYGLEA